MSNNIDIHYVWTKDIFLEASKATYDYELKHSSKRFLGWFFIAMTQFGVVGALKKDAYALLLVSTLLVIYWYALRWPLRRYMIEKSFKRSTTKEHKFVLSTSEEGISVNGNLLTWKSIKEVVSVVNGFLLYHGDEFLYIPKSAFKMVDEKDRFFVLLKKYIKQYSKEL